MDFDAVVLAGGAGTRLGGADKAGLMVGGMSLLDRVLVACAGARRTVVVGVPRPTVRAVEWTLEQPPGGGPLAGLAAGVAVLPASPVPSSSPSVLVLATDLPQLRLDDVQRLVSALAGAEQQVDGAVFVDDAQRAQLLTAIYRRAALVQALTDLHPVANRPMRAMLSRLSTIAVPADGAAADIDTAEHLAAARAAVSDPTGKELPMSDRSSDQLQDWVRVVCEAKDIDPAVVDIAAVLDLAKEAAHGIARPAAPLTTFMAGYLAGRAGGSALAAQAALEELAALVPSPPDLDTPSRPE